MGYVRPAVGGKNIVYGKTEEYKTKIQDEKKDSILEVFNHLVELVNMSKMSTPTSSQQDLADEANDNDIDNEVLEAELTRLDLNQ